VQVRWLYPQQVGVVALGYAPPQGKMRCGIFRRKQDLCKALCRQPPPDPVGASKQVGGGYSLLVDRAAQQGHGGGLAH
jgi:hypothetical protein